MKMDNSKQEWEKYQLKQKALKYYQTNKVPEKMEYILNLMFHEDPDDVYGYLANYFETYACPITIHNIQAYPAWNSKGEPTLGIDIYCVIKNKKKLVSSMISSGYDSEIWDEFKIKHLIEEKEKKLVSVKVAIDYINGSLGEQFHGSEILNSQKKADVIIKAFFDDLQLTAEAEEKRKQEALIEAGIDTASTNVTDSGPTEVSVVTEAERGSATKRSPGKKSAKAAKSKVDVTLPPNDPPYEWVPGSPAGSALSQAVCTAEATVRDVPLFEHIASLANENNQVPTSYKLPFLMVTMLHCGKLSSGKVNAFKEILLIPSMQFSIKECVSHLLSIHDCMISILLDAYPKQMYSINKVSDIGSITVQFDKPELVLDLIIEAIEAADFTPGEDFSIAINCASHENADLDKGRYEFVTGINMKSLEDAIDFWVDLIKSYPAIVALIDPLRKKEGQLYLQLCELISSHCLILGETNVFSPEKYVSDCKVIKTEGTSSNSSNITFQPTEEKSVHFSSGQILKMQQSTTVTDLINSVASLQEAGMYAVLSLGKGEGRETFIADLKFKKHGRIFCQDITRLHFSFIRDEAFTAFVDVGYFSQWMLEIGVAFFISGKKAWHKMAEAVGIKCKFLRTGGLSRGERFHVLNRLIYIEQILMKSGQLEKETACWTFPKLVIEKASDPSETLE